MINIFFLIIMAILRLCTLRFLCYKQFLMPFKSMWHHKEYTLIMVNIILSFAFHISACSKNKFVSWCFLTERVDSIEHKEQSEKKNLQWWFNCFSGCCWIQQWEDQLVPHRKCRHSPLHSLGRGDNLYGVGVSVLSGGCRVETGSIQRGQLQELPPKTSAPQ